MSIATFRGGVHPYEGKDLSKDLPIKTVQPKKELVFPMGQHIGAPATPIVAKGDKVLVGQKIGEASGFISANICSSVSGTVKAVEPRMLLNGSQATCVVIENDGEYAAIEGLGEDRDYTKLSADEIRDIVKEAGVVGMGGAGFPTNVKLAPKEPDKIDYILVNETPLENLRSTFAINMFLLVLILMLSTITIIFLISAFTRLITTPLEYLSERMQHNPYSFFLEVFS